MKTRILGYSKDKKTAKVRFDDDDFSITKTINCGFENGEFSKSLTDIIIEAQAKNIESKRAIGLL